jgi:hypothetical protein
MALQKYQVNLLILGFLPAMMAVLAGLILVAMIVAQKITPDVTQEFLKSAGAILLILTVVLLVISRVCMNIQPIERFADHSAKKKEDPVQELYTGIIAAEKDVCKLMTRVDHFIQGDVGHPGIKDPTLVSEAQQNARTAAGGPLVECSHQLLIPTPDASGKYVSSVFEKANEHLERLERTLTGFIEPELQRTYENTVICKEPFQDGKPPSITKLQQKLQKIQKTLQEQHTKWLDPVDEKTAALQRGKLSDCDKRRGAATQNKRGVKK